MPAVVPPQLGHVSAVQHGCRASEEGGAQTRQEGRKVRQRGAARDVKGGLEEVLHHTLALPLPAKDPRAKKLNF